MLAEAARPCRHAVGDRWQVDETYVKVAGHWTKPVGVLAVQCGPGVVAAIAITTALFRRRSSGRRPHPAT